MKQTEEQQIVKNFLGEKKMYEQSLEEIKQEYRDIYNAYMGKMEEVVSIPYDVKQSIPKLRTEIAYVKPFIFSGEPEIEVEGVGDEDKEISKILEKMVNYRIKQSIPDAYEKIEDWVHQAVTFGTSLIEVIWRFETKDNGDGTSTPIVDEPDLEIPNIMDTYWNPMIPSVDGQVSIITRSVLPIADVKSNPAYNFKGFDGKLNVDKLEGKGNLQSSDTDSSSQLSSTVLSNQEGMVEIFERKTKDRIQTYACGNKTLLLRDVENPNGYIPTIKLIFERNTIPNIFNGMGVGQNTLGLGEAYYKLFNQTLKNVKMSNNPMAVYAKGTKINQRELVSKPAGGVEVDTQGKNLADVFQWTKIPDITTGALDMLNKIEDEHKRASGSNDLVQGSASNDTLGQDQLAQANISNRFELIVRRFKKALSEVARIIIDMELRNLQNAEAPILRIFPDQIGTGRIDPMTGQEIMQTGIRQRIYELLINEAQDVKYNIKIKGNTNVARNRELESKRLVDLFDLSQNFLTDKEKRAFVRKIAERQGEQNIDEIIEENNPIADQQEQMQAMQGQMPQGQYNEVNQGEAQRTTA